MIPEPREAQTTSTDLQLLCRACNRAKGLSTQAELIAQTQGTRPGSLTRSLSDRAASSANAKSGDGSAKANGRAMNIRAKLVAAIDASDLTDRKLSVLATGTRRGPQPSPRNNSQGEHPRAALPRDGAGTPDHSSTEAAHQQASTPAPASPTTFTANRELPVYE